MKDDPGNLDRMHDLVLPPPVPWWPPTPGWWIVIGCALFLLAVLCFAMLIRWQANRYRREALTILNNPRTPPAMWPSILKQCALACWPRTRVASLTGADWDSFYRRSVRKEIPAEGTGSKIEELAFSGKASEAEELEASARGWIHHHRREDAP